MLPKQLSKNPSKSVLNVESLEQLVIELNEQNQATISGGYTFPCDCSTFSLHVLSAEAFDWLGSIWKIRCGSA